MPLANYTTPGQIGIALANATPITTTTGGSLVLITFQANANAAAGASAINLAATNAPFGVTVTTRLDSLTTEIPLAPAPTNAANDAGVDGLVTIAGSSTANAAAQFAVNTPGTAIAGTSFFFTVTAEDTNGNTVVGYAGTVQFASSDTLAMLPANYTFGVADNGVHVFGVTLKTPGVQSITATDTSNSSLTGVSAAITVSPILPTQFVFPSLPTVATAGVPFSVTVAAEDVSNQVETGYNGTVNVGSSDSQSSLPAQVTFTNGTATFVATFKTAAFQTIQITTAPPNSITGSSTSITVVPAAPADFVISGLPAASVGIPAYFTVTPEDQFGNTISSYYTLTQFTTTDRAGNIAQPRAI